MQKIKGRPRKFDADQVVQRAAALFAQKGFAATSLDDLSEATGLARPSLYNAFGDKLSLYRQSLAYHLRETHGILRRELRGAEDIRTELARFFDAMLAFYGSGSGCLTLCTAPAEALNHPEIAEDMRVMLAAIGQLLEARFERAAEAGQLRSHVTPTIAAQATQALLHSLALQARAGRDEATLREVCYTAVALLAA